MVDWTIERYDGYVGTVTTGDYDIITIDTTDINGKDSYYVCELDVTILSIKNGVSEGGAAHRIFYFVKWAPGIAMENAAGSLVRVGTDAVDNITLYHTTPNQYMLIYITPHTAEATQHQAIVVARVFEPD